MGSHHFFTTNETIANNSWHPRAWANYIYHQLSAKRSLFLFPGTPLSLFYNSHYSSTIRQRVLIGSFKVLSFHFSQTPASAFRFSLQFCSLGLQLWHCQSFGATQHNAGKARCRDEERSLYHISRCITWNADPVFVAVAVAHNATISNSAVAAVFESGDACAGSCIVTLNLLILTDSWTFLYQKTFHMSWLEQNNVYALHSEATWNIYTPPK